MIDPTDLCRELQEALDSNSVINPQTGKVTTWVDPSFFARLRAVAGRPRDGTDGSYARDGSNVEVGA